MNYSLLWKPRKLLASVRRRLDKRRTVARAIRASEVRFGSDPNYRLDMVPDFFAPRSGATQDDSAILKRIAAAYRKAKADQREAGEAFNVTNEWLPIYKRNLGPVMEALLADDIGELQRMYRNFFRDPCSTGLVGLPIDMPKVFFGGSIKPKYRKYILGDVLHRFGLWKTRTENAYSAESLASPAVGNPFGYTIDGVFVRAGGDYQHYYAHAIRQLLSSSDSRVVVELGGGFGGLAYFLVRDNPAVTYVDFDLPEALALASYYLMMTLPDRPILLYGEADFSEKALSAPGMIMMPSFEVMKMPSQSSAISFNSYSLAEMSPLAVRVYIDQIARITSGHFLHVNHNRNAVLSADFFGVEERGFSLINRQLAGWTSGINPESDEYEYLYLNRRAPQTTQKSNIKREHGGQSASLLAPSSTE